MNVGVATIAAILLLLPGVGFIIGVNFADKNVREIIFRNTPAELGYVITVSLVVHLLLAILSAVMAWILLRILPLKDSELLSFVTLSIAKFNVAAVYVKYPSLSTIPLDRARNILIFSLLYFFVAAVVGFVPGVRLGRVVREQRWRWTSIFAKHRWMLHLIQNDGIGSVSARALLKDKFASASDGKDQNILLQGLLRDSFFAADGKLLYLVFESFEIFKADGSSEACLNGLARLTPVTLPAGQAIADQLVVEGDRIQMVRYFRRSLSDVQIPDGEVNPSPSPPLL